jgi:arylsulfatase A-like enzyme
LPWFSPLKIGFDVFFGNLDGAMDYFTHLDTRGEQDLYEGETPIEMQGYYTSLIADRAVSYVNEQSADVPFYMQVNWNAPHWPWEGPGDEAVAAEIASQFANPANMNPLRHADGGSIAKYAELVEAMDTGIGQILDALEAKGLADDTIVIFCSDNGGERYSFMWPFVGEKGDITEGGIRVPFLFSWPAAVDGGQWTDATCITMDWTASLLAAAHCSPSVDWPLDGVNLLPWLIDGADHPLHTLFWRIASQGALRKGAYKFIVDNRPHPGLGNWPLFPGVRHQLFDVSGDGREHADLAALHPELLAEMKAEWKAYAATLLPYPANHRNTAENVVEHLSRRRYESWSD